MSLLLGLYLEQDVLIHLWATIRNHLLPLYSILFTHSSIRLFNYQLGLLLQCLSHLNLLDLVALGPFSVRNSILSVYLIIQKQAFEHLLFIKVKSCELLLLYQRVVNVFLLDTLRTLSLTDALLQVYIVMMKEVYTCICGGFALFLSNISYLSLFLL